MAVRFGPGGFLRTRFARLSLRWRLSWLLALSTVLTVTVYGFVTYRAAQAAAIDAAHARLRSALVQINTITELGTIQQLDSLKTIAREPAVIAAFLNPDHPLSAEASATLRRLQGTAPNSVTIELVGREGTTLQAIPASAQAMRPAPSFNPPPEGAIGPLFESGGVTAFQSGIALPDAGGAIVVTRRLSASNANRRITENLLGEHSALLIGNQDGKLWNESGTVQYPGQSGTATRYVRGGTIWLSEAAYVKGTPWMNAVEIPEHVALAPARALVMPFLIAGALIALVGAFIGLRVSQKITTPLADLTAATEAIARGDRNVPLATTDREDEIGRLARAFAKMAANVSAVQNHLESEVDARTGELSIAVEQLRRLDAELRQNERFATLGRLSGNVSHELRNPLGVMNTVTALLDDLAETSPRVKQYAQLLREQIRLSERIINDLLDRARSDAPILSTVDVAHLLDETISRADVPESIKVERHYQSPLPPVTIDRDQVGQIIWNLLTNAIQSMQSVPGKPHTLAVRASVDPQRLRIEVADTGAGVPEDALDRLFEPMYTTKSGGVGLGLSISRSFARANGGDLTLSPVPGGGACFVLDLPVTRERPA